MKYEFLKKLFGEEQDGEPKSMTYEELEAAIDADPDLNLVNLKEGGYISKGKYDRKETELEAVKTQLEEANNQIKSFEGQDIEGIKNKVSEWEKKYQEDTESLKSQMEAQEIAHQRDMYFNNVQFASNAAKIGIMSEFDKQKFQLKDGVFQGADNWLEEQKKNDPASFVLEEEKEEPHEEPHKKEPKVHPKFVTSTSNGSGLSDDQKTPFSFGFRHVREVPQQK